LIDVGSGIGLALEWAESHTELLWWLGVTSLALLIATALLVPIFVGRLPVDEFISERPPQHAWRESHPIGTLALRILRNSFGAICVVAGLAMLIMPGQGLLTLFAGILMLEFPGKRRLVLFIVGKRFAQRTLNWMRRKRRVPEFYFRKPHDRPPSRNERRARADAKSATTTISPDSPTKKKTSS
jgi:hypothetical protein